MNTIRDELPQGNFTVYGCWVYGVGQIITITTSQYGKSWNIITAETFVLALRTGPLLTLADSFEYEMTTKSEDAYSVTPEDMEKMAFDRAKFIIDELQSAACNKTNDKSYVVRPFELKPGNINALIMINGCEGYDAVLKKITDQTKSTALKETISLLSRLSKIVIRKM